MRAALLIARNDLRQRLRDRSFFMSAFLVPLVLAFVFNLIAGNLDSAGFARFAVVDQDHGAIAQAFNDRVLKPVAKEGLITVRTASSLQEGRKLAEDGTVAATFVVPAGFTAAVQSGQPATMQVIGNADSPVGVEVARSIAEAFAAEIRSARLSVAVALRGPPKSPDQVAKLAERATAVRSPVSVDDQAARQFDLKTYFAASMAMFFLFFAVALGVGSLLDERRNGTMARLLAAPIPKPAILWGKILTSFITGMISMAVLAVATTFLLGAKWGNPFGVALLMVAGVFAATGIMALVATMCQTGEQANRWQIAVAAIMGLLGGSFFPITQASAVIATMSYVTPHRWFLQGLSDLSGGGRFTEILPAVGVLLAFGVVAGAVALRFSGRMLRP